MTFLKQSTAVTVKMGPFVDSTDGVTAETALTISQADIRLSKNGGAFAQTNNAAGATHDENGQYGVPLDTTDTATLGALRVAVNESGALPVWRDFMIVPANVWDSLFGADKLQVHADEITAGLITAAAIATGAIDADAVAADAVTEIQSGLATAAAVAALNNLSAAQVNTEVDTALADVGLTTTITGRIDAAVSTRASAADMATALGYIDTEIAAILDDTGTSGVALGASTINSIADGVLDRSITEPSAVFTWPASLRGIIRFIGALARNKITQTNTTQTLRNDADNAAIGTSTVSSDGTTTTRGEFS